MGGLYLILDSRDGGAEPRIPKSIPTGGPGQDPKMK
jgi:hypothetical protein